jgi:hypothetical protein
VIGGLRAERREVGSCCYCFHGLTSRRKGRTDF